LDKEVTVIAGSKRGSQSGMKRSFIPVLGQTTVKSNECPSTRIISNSLDRGIDRINFHKEEEGENNITLVHPNNTRASTISRKSSSSLSSVTARRFSSSSSSTTFHKLDIIVDERSNNVICDVIFPDHDPDFNYYQYQQRPFGNNNNNTRPSYKVYPKMCSNGYSSKKSSRPGKYHYLLSICIWPSCMILSRNVNLAKAVLLIMSFTLGVERMY